MSPTTMTRLLVIFLFGGLGGWFASIRQAPPVAETTPISSVTTLVSKADRPRSPDEFRRWADSRASSMTPYSGWYTSHQSELVSWSVAELRAALQQGIGDPALVMVMSPESKAMYALLTEFTRRDPDAAWAWLESVRAEAMRSRLGGALAMGWPAERGEDGLALVLAHRDYFEYGGGYGYTPILQSAFQSAAARGPSAVAGMLVTVLPHGMGLPVGVKFPEGFDFAALMRQPEVSELLAKDRAGNIMDAWMKRDSDAAIDFLMESNRSRDQPVYKGVFSGISSMDSRESGLISARVRQTAAKVGELPAEEQRHAITAASEELSDRLEALREFTNALPDPSFRAEANLIVATVQLSKNMPAALEFLAAGSAPEERLGLLDKMLAAQPANSFQSLHGEAARAVRRTLTKWNAPPEKIDELLGVMKEMRR